MNSLSNMAQLGKSFEEFSGRLMKILDRRMDDHLKQRIGADELLQEVFLKVQRRFSRNPGSCCIDDFCWWYKQAFRKLSDVHRAHAGAVRNMSREVPYPSNSSILLARHLSTSFSTPSKQASKKEEMDLLKSAIDKLPDDLREILFMRFFDNLTFREMSEVLGCSDRHASNKCTEAIVRLGDDMGTGFAES